MFEGLHVTCHNGVVSLHSVTLAARNVMSLVHSLTNVTPVRICLQCYSVNKCNASTDLMLSLREHQCLANDYLARTRLHRLRTHPGKY